MTRQEFIDEAKRQGKSKEETFSKFKELDSSGRFDDSQAQPASQPGQSGLTQRIQARSEAVQAPTWAGNAVERTTGSNVLGQVVAVPERSLRLAGGAVGNLMDIPMTAAMNVPGVKHGFAALGNLGSAAGSWLAQRMPLNENTGIGRLVAAPANAAAGYQSWAAAHPELAQDVNAFGNLASIMPAGKLAGAGAKIGADVGEKAALATARGVNGFVGKAAAGLSGPSEEALRMASTKGGRAALQAASETQHVIGQKVVDMMEAPDKFLPEADAIHQALIKMPNISVENTLKAIDKEIDKLAVEPSKVKINERLEQLKNNIDHLD
jgi:hypothetical protein